MEVQNTGLEFRKQREKGFQYSHNQYANEDEYEYDYDYEEDEGSFGNEGYIQYPGIEINNSDRRRETNDFSSNESNFSMVDKTNSDLSVTMAKSVSNGSIKMEGKNIIIKKKVSNFDFRNNVPHLPEGMNIVLAKKGKFSDYLEETNKQKMKEIFDEQIRIFEENQKNLPGDIYGIEPSSKLPTIEEIMFKPTLSLNDEEYKYLCNNSQFLNMAEVGPNQGRDLSKLKTALSIGKVNNANKNINMKIELPNQTKSVKLTWQSPNEIPKFTNKKMTSNEQQLTITKNGKNVLDEEVNVFDNLSDYEEEEEKVIDGPSVELPGKGGGDVMHEVNLIGLDGKETNIKYIMLPNVNAKKAPDIKVVHVSEMDFEPLVTSHTYYTVEELRRIKTQMLKHNTLATNVRRTPGLDTLYRLHVEMKNPAMFRDVSYSRRVFLETVSRQQRSKNATTGKVISPNKQKKLTKEEAEIAEALKPTAPQNVIENTTLRDNKGEGTSIATLQTVVSSTPGAAKIIDMEDQDIFIPTIFKKSNGLWDDKSEDAFKLKVKTSLNRLTIKTIDEVNKVLSSLMDTPERVDYVVDIFCRKAINEVIFTPLYAKFSKECQCQEFRVKVVQETINKFFLVIANPGRENRESDVNEAQGISSFFACLVSQSAMQESNGKTALNSIMEKLNSAKIQPIYIDMLHSFVGNVGPAFNNNVSPDVWLQIKGLLKRDDIKSRYKFLLNEVIEIKEKGITAAKSFSEPVVKKATDTTTSIVRALFEDFMHNGDVYDNDLDPVDFLSAALQILPDINTGDIFNFSMFVGDQMKKLRAYVDDCIDAIEHAAVEFDKNGTINDCLLIWVYITDITLGLLFNGVIEINDAIDIHSIYSAGEWDYISDIKWYLYDNYDFSKPLFCPGLHDEDLRTSLNMPEILRSNVIKINCISRFTVVAITRTITTFMAMEGIFNYELLPLGWSRLLSEISRKHYKTLLEEVEKACNMFRDFNFSAQNFVGYFQMFKD